MQAVSALIFLLGIICVADMAATFSELNGFVMLIIGGAAVCAVYFAAALFSGIKWLPVVLLCAVLTTGLLFYADVNAGIRLICNHVFENLTALTGRLFLEFPVDVTPEKGRLCVCLGFGILGVPVGLISWLGSVRFPRISALCLLVVLSALLVIVRPEVGDLRIWLAFLSVALLLFGPVGFGIDRWVVSVQRMVVLLLCWAVCFGVVSTVPSIRDNELFVHLRNRSELTIHSVRYEMDDYVILPEGDFSRLDKQTLPTGTVLEVIMEQPETLYLRGFVGDSFDGQRWKTMSNEALQENSGLLYWLHRVGVYPQTQLSAVMELLPEDISGNRVTVRNLMSCSQYFYVPYNLSAFTAGGTLDAFELTPSVVRTEGLYGIRNYSFTTVNSQAEQLETLLDVLKNSEDEKTQEYLSAEGSYRQLVYQQDLQIPAEILTQLQPVLDECCAQFGSRDTLTASQAQVSTWLFLQKYNEMFASGNSPVLGQGENISGTDFERVTITALALRYFGIPARYVEGYLVTEQMASNVEPGETLAITAESACAWVEVYQDGIGWLPLELTPGYNALSSAVIDPDSEKDGESVHFVEGEELEEPDTQKDTDLEETPQDQSQTKLEWVQKSLLWLLLLIPLLLMGVWLRHAVILKKRTAGFSAQDIHDAVSLLFADSVNMLKYLGLDRGKGSLLTLVQQVESRFGVRYARRYRVMVELNGKAIFSSHQLEEIHRTFAKTFRADTCKLLRKRYNWFQRLWLRWIRCLY